ncbi:hypothetical protein E1301_Tti023229 [Triplophysa tibetana]|uniref:Ig-like domain-containing protein n=1 Tax=Triplophysa tibetana TaxID=1572043 RepID=A0A5A9MUD8_9TELE|nr:hypothetical protein E1301_Tti023229 [Triplophysa tibetana]
MIDGLPLCGFLLKDKPVIEVPPLREHEQANLSCSAPSPCPETPPNITWWITKRNGGITEVKNENYSTTSEGFYNSTLTLTPTSELYNATVGCNVSYGDKKNISTNKTIEVMHGPTFQILGHKTVNEGDTLRLSCTVDSHPASSDPVWTLNGSTDKLMNHTSGENLTITNMAQTNIDLTVTNEQTPLHNQSDAEMSYTPVELKGGEEESEAGGAENGEAGEAAAGDLDYAAIDYSLLKQKPPEEEEDKSINTDYAEIKRDEKGRKALQIEHDQTEDQKQDEEEGLYSDPDALKGQA